MKKKIIYGLMLCVLLMTSCQSSQPLDITLNNFTDISWTRDGGHDSETICFRSSGAFAYYCSCGNPVNDSDLCDGYVFDEDTGEIALDYFELTDEVVTNLKIVNLTTDTIEIDFDGEIRTFTKED